MILKFFAVSQMIAFIGWYALAWVRAPRLRLLLRTFVLSFFLTPGAVIGHGYAVVPAGMAVFYPGGFYFGLLPILIVWCVSFAIGYFLQKKGSILETAGGQFRRSLVTPAPWKSLLYGSMAFVLFAGFATSRAGGVNVLTGLIAGFLICFYGGRYYHRNLAILPLIFVLPLLSSGSLFISPGIVIPVAFLWFVAGIAGGLAAKKRWAQAYLLAAIVSILFLAMGVQRIIAAVKYQDVPHVKIEGGVPLALAWTLVFLALSVGFGYLAWNAQKNRGRSFAHKQR